MIRLLQWLNLLGILALASLCAEQWQVNRTLNLQNIALESRRIQQEATIADQIARIKADAADLDEMRSRLLIDETAIQAAMEKIAVLQQSLLVSDAARKQLQAERDALKSALGTWQAAVAQRDAVLKDADQQLQKLIADRNAAVLKFNDLAGKYNDLVKQLNAARSHQ
jgi:chromosome segregation ATPase